MLENLKKNSKVSVETSEDEIRRCSKRVVFISVQFLSDSDPPAEGEHWNGPAGAASGCQECRAGGKHDETLSSRLYGPHDGSGLTKLDS